ncbi:MAG: Uma2 family endonuclease [Hyphomicrobiaceae bacterium]
MFGAAQKVMTVEEFFVWQQSQEERYELVEGVPVLMGDPAKMMTGASSQHDRITSNVLVALGNQLEGSPCWPATADLALRTKIRSLRRADVLVTCDEPALDVYEAQEPKMVVEVLSPSNKGLPWQRKIEEYRQHPKLVYLLLIDSEAEQATLISRTGESWTPQDYDGRDSTMELPVLDCRLAMAAVYAGVKIQPAA